MAATDWSSADLKAIDFQGWIHEDVMDAIWDITRIPLPLTDMIGSDSVSNAYTEWNIDALADPDTGNAVVDGADITQNDAQGGARVGNQCQESVKAVRVTQRARSSDTMDSSDELARQVTRRQQELRRDVEAIMLYDQPSQSDDGNTTPGLSAGLSSWLTTNTDRGNTGSDGGFSGGTVSAPTDGDKRAGSEDGLRALVTQIWEGGGEPMYLMAQPATISGLSRWLLTDAAKIAVLQSDAGQSSEEMTAKGSVNVLVSDHGQTIMFRPNRLQPDQVTAGQGSAFILNPEYLRQGFLQGYRTQPLAKTGLTDPRMMSVDWTLKVLNEAAHGVYADIDYTIPWVA